MSDETEILDEINNNLSQIVRLMKLYLKSYTGHIITYQEIEGR